MQYRQLIRLLSRPFNKFRSSYNQWKKEPNLDSCGFASSDNSLGAFNVYFNKYLSVATQRWRGSTVKNYINVFKSWYKLFFFAQISDKDFDLGINIWWGPNVEYADSKTLFQQSFYKMLTQETATANNQTTLYLLRINSTNLFIAKTLFLIAKCIVSSIYRSPLLKAVVWKQSIRKTWMIRFCC